MGHLSPQRELLTLLKKRGHEVHVAARDVGRAERAFDGLGFTVWQAPIAMGAPDPVLTITATVAHVLHNGGFGDTPGLLARSHAWDSIVHAVDPGLVLTEYAPTLLLALRGMSIPTAALGNGFVTPPRIHPAPVFDILVGQLPPGTSTSEAGTLESVNTVLTERGQRRLDALTDLYNDGPLPLLKTLPELDHYGVRENALYMGSPAPPPGDPPNWPDGEGPRVFAYLKPTQGIAAIVYQLSQLGHPTLIVGDGVPDEIKRRLGAENLSFAPRAVELREVVKTCRLAVANGNMGTVSHFLLHGIPVLSAPISLEQRIMAGKIDDIGAGLVVTAKSGAGTGDAARRLLEEPSFRSSAEDFASRQSQFRELSYEARVMAELEKLTTL